MSERAMVLLSGGLDSSIAEGDAEGLRRLLRAALDALSLPLDTAAGAR